MQFSIKLGKAAAIVALIVLAGCAGKEGPHYPVETRIVEEVEGRQEQLLAYEHNIDIGTSEAQVAPLYEKVIAACKADTANACVLLDSNISSGREVRARINLRARPTGIKKIVSLVGSAGEVTSQGTKVQDLGRPVLDSRKRLVMLKQYQTQLQELEQRSSKDVDALIKVTKELATVQTELEQATAANALLMQRIDTDLLTIDISSEGRKSFWSPIKQSLGNFTENLSEGAANGITALAYLLPWLLAFAIVFPLLRKGWRRLRAPRKGVDR